MTRTQIIRQLGGVLIFAAAATYFFIQGPVSVGVVFFAVALIWLVLALRAVYVRRRPDSASDGSSDR